MTDGMLRATHWLVAKLIADAGQLDLRRYSEPVRQRVIDLAMHEPPYADIDADRVLLTDEGRKALAERLAVT